MSTHVMNTLGSPANLSILFL